MICRLCGAAKKIRAPFGALVVARFWFADLELPILFVPAVLKTVLVLLVFVLILVLLILVLVLILLVIELVFVLLIIRIFFVLAHFYRPFRLIVWEDFIKICTRIKNEFTPGFSK